MKHENTTEISAQKAAKQIMQLVIAHQEKAVREAVEDIRKWVGYNKHDMGELGEFIRTKYVYNKLDELTSKESECELGCKGARKHYHPNEPVESE